MKPPPAPSTRQLLATERLFVGAMQRLGFGRFESLQIRGGELVLDPWPTTIQAVKFGTNESDTRELPADFGLKRQVVELFEYVRSVGSGEIRCLAVRHGLPFSMEVAHRPGTDGGWPHA